MSSTKPIVVVIGGPNGAGKTTVSKRVLSGTIGVLEFVNADVIAKGLSAFNPEQAAIAAGRVMLTRLRALAASRSNFAFESTLASRTFAPWLKTLKQQGYEIHLLYVTLRSPELALQRVKARVQEGGHDVPPEVIRRRFGRSARNLFDLYLPIADVWRVYENSAQIPVRIAHGSSDQDLVILKPKAWNTLYGIAHENKTRQADSQ